ncbi:hypothetical protein BDA96_09G037000 [Sorghum bicolor]|uniref:Uncharacterized protein n=1 Tax=Sorghum bicolor TaxID=4558 RepID=A0A921U3G5_SORBI|nr:hypothetical protein BDA96_09G037000 [Sorghum bicolor]
MFRSHISLFPVEFTFVFLGYYSPGPLIADDYFSVLAKIPKCEMQRPVRFAFKKRPVRFILYVMAVHSRC